MLKDIFDVVSKIGEFISTAWDFVIDFLTDTFEMIKLVGDSVAKIPTYISWLPPELLAVVIAIFGVIVIYKILGREG